MFRVVTSPAFDDLLPGFDVDGPGDGSIDERAYARVLSGFGLKRDIFVFWHDLYPEKRYRRDRAFYRGDRDHHQWSGMSFWPERLMEKRGIRAPTPHQALSACCRLARDLVPLIEAHGVRDMAFVAIVTLPSEDGIDEPAYTFKLVTGEAGVREFAVIAGDQPMMILIRG